MCPDRVRDLTRIRALGGLDRGDHDAGRRQRPGLLHQRAAEVVHLHLIRRHAGVLGEKLPHLGDVLVVAATLLSALLHHRRATDGRPHTGHSARPRSNHAGAERRPGAGAHRRAGTTSKRTLHKRLQSAGFLFGSAAPPLDGPRRAPPFAAAFLAHVPAVRAAPISVELPGHIRKGVVTLAKSVSEVTAA